MMYTYNYRENIKERKYLLCLDKHDDLLRQQNIKETKQKKRYTLFRDRAYNYRENIKERNYTLY